MHWKGGVVFWAVVRLPLILIGFRHALWPEKQPPAKKTAGILREICAVLGVILLPAIPPARPRSLVPQKRRTGACYRPPVGPPAGGAPRSLRRCCGIMAAHTAAAAATRCSNLPGVARLLQQDTACGGTTATKDMGKGGTMPAP